MNRIPCSALLIHGLTATPSELAPLGAALEQEEFQISLPLLPGHGTTLQDLRVSTASEWLDSARRALASLPAGPTVIIGESLGAILGLLLTAEQRALGNTDIRASISLSLPFQFGSSLYEQLFPLLSYLPEPLLSVPYFVQKPTRDPRRNTHPYVSYPAHHLGSLGRVARLRRKLFRSLSLIEAPVLILQDPTESHVNPAGARRYVKHFPQATLKEFPGASHQMVCGPKSDAVIKEVLAFVLTAMRRVTDAA